MNKTLLEILKTLELEKHQEQVVEIVLRLVYEDGYTNGKKSMIDRARKMINK